MTDRLYRSREERMLAGVAGGLAQMLEIDPSIVRIVWAVLVVLTGGLALLVYVVMAVVVPEQPYPAGSSTWHAAGPSSSDTRPAPGMSDQRGTGPATWGPARWDAGPASGTEGWRPGGPPNAGPQRAPSGWPPGDDPTRRRRDERDRGQTGLVAGIVLIVLGGFFLVRRFIPEIDPSLWWPAVAILLGVVLVVVALLPSRRSR